MRKITLFLLAVLLVGCSEGIPLHQPSLFPYSKVAEGASQVTGAYAASSLSEVEQWPAGSGEVKGRLPNQVLLAYFDASRTPKIKYIYRQTDGTMRVDIIFEEGAGNYVIIALNRNDFDSAQPSVGVRFVDERGRQLGFVQVFP